MSQAKRSWAGRLVASVLVISVQALMLPVGAAPEQARITGTVVSTGDHAPLAGVTVHVADPRTGAVASAEATDPDGRFVIEGLDAAVYEIAVESNGGLYLVPNGVEVAAGDTRVLNLIIDPSAVLRASTVPGARRPASGVWDNPLTAALIVVGIAFAIGALIESATSEDEASPS